MSDTVTIKTLTLSAAKKIANQAVLKAQELGVPGAIAVVDVTVNLTKYFMAQQHLVFLLILSISPMQRHKKTDIIPMQ